MDSSWVDAETVSRRLQEEATCSATRLGHRLTSFVAAHGQKQLFVARCVDCSGIARVSVRNPHRAPIAGAVVELRCPSQGKHLAVFGPRAA